jgi:hypothetical protein
MKMKQRKCESFNTILIGDVLRNCCTVPEYQQTFIVSTSDPGSNNPHRGPVVELSLLLCVTVCVCVCVCVCLSVC